MKNIIFSMISLLVLFSCADSNNQNNTNNSNVCSGVTCAEHGTCSIDLNGLPYCVCEVGYTPNDNLQCVLILNASCDGVTCSGHGTCSMVNASPSCNCEVGYTPSGLECILTGSNNTNNSNTCNGITCSSHGTCQLDDDGNAVCNCDSCYTADGLNCIEDVDPCIGVTCSGHGDCVEQDGSAYCNCDSGYYTGGDSNTECIPDNADSCDGITCSGHGTCMVWSDGPVCACDTGYTPSSSQGLDCVPTAQICKGGAINYDYDNDGTVDTWFDPNDEECLMYEIVNRTRATHDAEGTPECHYPLMYSVEWSAHGRNHSYQMQAQGGLFHDDYPMGQNCAYGCGPDCEIDMYMNGANEDHCPPLSHHCNIMRCSFNNIGIGTVGSSSFNTQNFF